MWRVVTSTFVALAFFASAAAAQQPCTTDAGRVVSELYRHVLERGPDAGAQHWQQQLANGSMTVRDVVKNLATSQEYVQRFGQTESGEGTAYERAVARLYRHILGRQPDAEGQRNWAETAQRSGIGAVVDALLTSQEYSNNFGDWGVPGSGGLKFCANNAQSNTQAQPAQPQANQVTEPRFRGMDRNRDGTITRNEWRGSNQSFNVHDWDGNGVLEGTEVRAGAFRQGRTLEDEDLDRGERFDYLDANNNGRVERREWHMSVDAFNRLDRNRDGVLTRAEAESEFGGWGTSSGVATSGDIVSVDSSVRWTDTGITVRQGDTLTFDSEGQIRLSDNGNDFANAGGSSSGRRAANAPVASAPAGGLIARIGNGQAIYVGDRRALRAPASGRLYLGVNDDHLGDNQGTYRVTVDVR
jgi:Ca2+-binding EF-hand superfamily protein